MLESFHRKAYQEEVRKGKLSAYFVRHCRGSITCTNTQTGGDVEYYHPQSVINEGETTSM